MQCVAPLPPADSQTAPRLDTREVPAERAETGIRALAGILAVPTNAVWEYYPLASAQAIRTASVPAIDGSHVAVQYFAPNSEHQPPTQGWVYLHKNRHSADLLPRSLGVSCICPAASGCSDTRICPCAQFAREQSAVYYANTGLKKRLVASGGHTSAVFECAAGCRCDRRACGLTFLSDNTERFVSPPLALTYTDGAWGVVCLRGLSEGEFVLEVTGEVIPPTEAKRRQRPMLQLGLSSESLYLDNCDMGNLGRFLRTAEKPCLRVVRSFVEHKDVRLSRIAVFAARRIAAREILTARLPLYSNT